MYFLSYSFSDHQLKGRIAFRNTELQSKYGAFVTHEFSLLLHTLVVTPNCIPFHKAKADSCTNNNIDCWNKRHTRITPRQEAVIHAYVMSIISDRSIHARRTSGKVDHVGRMQAQLEHLYIGPDHCVHRMEAQELRRRRWSKLPVSYCNHVKEADAIAVKIWINNHVLPWKSFHTPVCKIITILLATK